MLVMAVDVGERRVGVAVSDPTGLLTRPLTTVKVTSVEQGVEAVADLAKEHEADRIVVGMPVSMDGVPRAQARAVEVFVGMLRERAEAEVVTWDERLTTVEADRRMREAGLSQAKRREQRDAAAAAVLLQAYLDGQR